MSARATLAAPLPPPGPAEGFVAQTRGISSRLGSLRESQPETMKSFSALGRAALAPGALDAKSKELVAFALGVASRCDPCIGFHAQALVRLGASRAEVDELLGVVVYMGGGPSLMYAAHALAAFDEFAAAAATPSA